METTESKRNPLEPISLPLMARAATAAFLAIYILLEFAREMMIDPSLGSWFAYGISTVLIVCAIWDGRVAFLAKLRLPPRSLEFHGIDLGYLELEKSQVKDDGDSVEKRLVDLLISDRNPNEGFLGWLGRWAARASDRFSQLPMPYQRLCEVAIIALVFAVISLVVAAFLWAYGKAGGRYDLSKTVLSWFSVGLVVLTYIYWMLMYLNVRRADKWTEWLIHPKRLFDPQQLFHPNNIVIAIAGGIGVLVLAGIATHGFGLSLPDAHSLEPLDTIAVTGSMLIFAGIMALTWLRSSRERSEMSCSRIQLNNSAAVHPESVVIALRSVLQQARSGYYREVGKWGLKLEEQQGISGGTFTGLLVGEYGAVLLSLASQPIRHVATGIGIIGMILSAAAYVMLWQSVHAPDFDSGIIDISTAVALYLFGELAFELARIPLSETLWESHLMGFDVKGSYQSRGAVLASAQPQNLEYGNFLVDYALDGGIAKVRSVAYLPATRVKADAYRLIVTTAPDSEDEHAVRHALEMHLARAAGRGSEPEFAKVPRVRDEAPALPGDGPEILPVPSRGEPAVILTGTAGTVQGRRIPIDKPMFRIGRNDTNDLVIEGDTAVSGSHVWLCYTEGTLLLIDQHSSNGTWLNGKPVRPKGEKIDLGDRIQVGLCAFEVTPARALPGQLERGSR